MYFAFVPMTETLIPVAEPARLKPGSVVVRCWKAGEAVAERWTVVRWVTPPPPSPGQAWGSGFLMLVGSEESNRGERLQVGPRKAVIRDFCQCVESASEPEDVTTIQPRRSYWWERD